MAEETPEGYESPRERRERIREERERRDAAAGGGGDNPDAPERYDIPAILRRRNEMGEKIWRAVAEGRLNLSNQDQLGQFLSSIGLLDQKEEGRHMRRMFLGALDPEGWGMGENGYSRALDEYRPNWSRMISGMKKDPRTGLYGTDGGKWYDAFGRLVRTDPVAAAPTTPTTPTTPAITPPSATATSKPTTPGGTDTNGIPPAFYGGTTAPNPYGVNPSSIGQTDPTGRRRIAGRVQNQTPGWYSTWRF